MPRAFASGDYTVPMTDLLLVTTGNVGGAARVNQYGRNADVDIASVPEDLIEQGGLYQWRATAGPVRCVSSSANDAAAGTGARIVRLIGLDANFLEIREDVVLNGVTPVDSTQSFLRLNYAIVVSGGSSKVNAGTITLSVPAGATLNVILPGNGVIRSTHYTVPAGKTYVLTGVYLAVNRDSSVTNPSAGATVSFYIQPNDGTNANRLPIDIGFTDGSAFAIQHVPIAVLAEKTDFVLRVTSVTADNMGITGIVTGITIENGQLQ